MLPRDGNAGRVNLRVARVGEVGPTFVRAMCGADVAAHGVGREKERVRVATGGQAHRIGCVTLDRPGDEVACDDAFAVTIDDHDVEHLAAGLELDRAGLHLAHEGLVRAEQKLLTGLSARVEGSGDLSTSEGAIGQKAAVLPRKRHPLRDTLIDDVDADFGQPMHVGFARAVVTAFDGVVEEAVNAVAVVLIVLGRVDAALGRDAVGAPSAVLETQRQHVVAEFAQAGRGAGPGEAGTDHDDVVLAFVRGVHQLQVKAVIGPFFGHGAGGNLGVECGHRALKSSVPE